MVALIVLAAALSIFAISLYLAPDTRGHGTHEQLGLPPCGFLMATGFPCPSCGMTTSFALTMRGRWISAFLVQPFGFLLATAVLAAAVGSIMVLKTGKVWVLNWWRISPWWVVVGFLGLLLLGWGFKMGHVLIFG